MTSPIQRSLRRASWELLQPADLADVVRIAHVIHPLFFERPEVFSEKMRLFPEGCRKLVSDGECVGYGLAHPWMLGRVPALDAFLDRLPAEPSSLHVHDIAILAGHRGSGASRVFMESTAAVARRRGIGCLALASVYGTAGVWRRLGFITQDDPAARTQLRGYGPDACYMVREVRPEAETADMAPGGVAEVRSRPGGRPIHSDAGARC